MSATPLSVRTGVQVAPALPAPRGPLSRFVLDALRREPGPLGPAPEPVDDALLGEDSALALYCCYELHYRGFAGVDEAWEWEPSLIAVSRELERRLLARLDDLVGPIVETGDVAARLFEVISSGSGPSLSAYMAEEGTLEQFREMFIHRSAYQLKEADPHSWALPRLSGRAKAALVEIQADEYGDGVEKDMHANLFAMSMRGIGLDATYGFYLDRLPAITLSTVNLVTMFGIHRRFRGRLVGHLAVFEMTSVEPMGRYSVGLRRLGYGPWTRLFYDTHVVADAHHQSVAAHELAGGLADEEPEQAVEILYGAQAIMAVEGLMSGHLFDCWRAGRSSLRD
jgi:hypothetical protein